MPSFSTTLEQAIHNSLAEANLRKHELATPEHLLYALLEEPDTRKVLQACGANLDELSEQLREFFDDDPATLKTNIEGSEAVPTKSYQRIIQRAAIHVQASNRPVVTGAHVLTAIFSERKSTAVHFLKEQDVTRYDVVHFIANGAAKDPAFGQYRGEEVSEIIEEIETAKPGLKRSKKEERFVFISFARKDQLKVEAVRRLLEDNGINLWWDQDIEPGDTWREEISEKLKSASAVLTLWSENSTQSKAVIEEASYAQGEGRLVHIRLDDAELPFGFAETQYLSLQNWDGSENHPMFQRLLLRLQDTLYPPTLDEIEERLSRSSPVTFVARGGKLGIIDTPEHEPPSLDNPSELKSRLGGLCRSLTSIQRMVCDTQSFQLPNSLRHCLDNIQDALNETPLTWFALEDSRALLMDCMSGCGAKDAWNSTIVAGLLRIIQRIDEIQPYLEPRQPKIGEPKAKPPEPDPTVTWGEFPSFLKQAKQLTDELQSDLAQSVLDNSAQAAIARASERLDDLEEIGLDPDSKLPRARNVLKRLAFISGGVISTVATGVVVNLLTAPQALITLAERLQPILQALLQFFI